ncbi:MAG: hypothetical protein E2O29_01720 [Deltaproteobacteria bacterium]|nr:MAG: hypothetical protein E2O29_01720 [Deltaproteobacteria bacterium]
MNIQNCSVIRYLEKIADELQSTSWQRGERAKSFPDDNLWCMGAVQDRAEEIAFMVASGKVRGLNRDLAPEYLKTPFHCTCQNNELKQLILDDVPHKYQKRLLDYLGDKQNETANS